MRPLDEVEADLIRYAITHYRGQMSEVARRLQIGRSTLYRKLEALGLNSGEAKRRAWPQSDSHGKSRNLTAPVPADTGQIWPAHVR